MSIARVHSFVSLLGCSDRFLVVSLFQYILHVQYCIRALLQLRLTCPTNIEHREGDAHIARAERVPYRVCALRAPCLPWIAIECAVDSESGRTPARKNSGPLRLALRYPVGRCARHGRPRRSAVINMKALAKGPFRGLVVLHGPQDDAWMCVFCVESKEMRDNTHDHRVQTRSNLYKHMNTYHSIKMADADKFRDIACEFVTQLRAAFQDRNVRRAEEVWDKMRRNPVRNSLHLSAQCELQLLIQCDLKDAQSPCRTFKNRRQARVGRQGPETSDYPRKSWFTFPYPFQSSSRNIRLGQAVPHGFRSAKPATPMLAWVARQRRCQAMLSGPRDARNAGTESDIVHHLHMTFRTHARYIRIVKAVSRFLKSTTTAMATQTQTLLAYQHRRRAAGRPAGGR
jgi:hypothetical protein